jgi:hypothetical protein
VSRLVRRDIGAALAALSEDDLLRLRTRRGQGYGKNRDCYKKALHQAPPQIGSYKNDSEGMTRSTQRQ